MFESVVRQFIPTYHSAPAIIVIAQQWPCWLSTALALGLPVIGGYFSSRFHGCFEVSASLKLMTSWSTVEHFRGIDEEHNNCTVLASGSINFVGAVERGCVGHKGPLIFAADHYFARTGARDTTRLYRSWGCHRMREGYVSGILSHAEHGGATNAVHFVFHRGLSSTIPRPASSVPRLLKHFVNSAARGGYVAIEPPPALPHDGVARQPLVVDEMGRIEGLYDVYNPALEYAIPSVFKASGWVRRRLSPKEWLSLYDIPVDMIPSLSVDATARNAISLCITPLIVGALFRAWWGFCEGGEAPSAEEFGSEKADVSTDHQGEVEEGVVKEGVLEERPERQEAKEHHEEEEPMEEGQHEEEDLMALIKVQHDLAKAVKADGATVPVHLWDDRICRGGIIARASEALEALRGFFLRVYRRRLCRDGIRFLVGKYGPGWSKLGTAKADASAMREIMWRAAHNEWFDYPVGSRLHFFRFPTKYRALARDGVPNFFITPGPTQRRPQPTPTPEASEILRDKILKMIQRRYLVTPSSKVASLIQFFAVPKGEGDYRVVYHAGANGLNDCVWAPPFFLPTVESLLRIVDGTSCMEDRDIGEMFLNFELHPNTRRFTGVDVGPLGIEVEGKKMHWLMWTKNLMGFRSSPYNSVKMYLIVEEVVRGDRRDPTNPFQWDHIKLNLPGTPEYNPLLSWITKRRIDSSLASDLVDFVDDERVVGSGSKRARQAGHAVSTRESYLGLHDALRKLRPVTPQPGAWAGVVVHNDPTLGIVVLTSQEKWDRTKSICRHWMNVLLEGKSEVPFKQLESDRGFLVYVANAYPAMKPYLKGFHLSLEMWRGGRDEEGWKLKQDPVTVTIKEEDLLDDKGFVRERGPASGFTPIVPQFRDDLEALLLLTSGETPVK